MIARARPEAVTGALLLVALAYFVIQTAAFPFQMRPDEYKAVEVFVGMVSHDVVLSSEAFTRAVVFGLNVALTLGLFRLGLITRETLVVACLWPMTIFLYSKLYWEVFVFPLCLIRLDLRLQGEVGLIAGLGVLLLVTGEANLAVLILFRAVLAGQKIGFRRFAPLVFLLAGIGLSAAMSAGIAGTIPFVGEHLARFSWTRNVVNPEYSVFETAAVFLTSFHFFTLHTGLWAIDATVSVLVVATVALTPGAGARLRANWPAALGFGCVVLGLTEVTHAFQNARYYFFYIPLVAALTPPAAYPALGVLGLAHVGIKAAEAFWLG